ncbi:MAG: hypothetical protein U5K84_11350 [Alkalibacterium sp.]|nr:hypothetical protein [Alkalibacterium sp.]
MDEERIWNITAFTYEKAGEDSYSGLFDFRTGTYYSESVEYFQVRAVVRSAG